MNYGEFRTNILKLRFYSTCLLPCPITFYILPPHWIRRPYFFWFFIYIFLVYLCLLFRSWARFSLYLEIGHSFLQPLTDGTRINQAIQLQDEQGAQRSGRVVFFQIFQQREDPSRTRSQKSSMIPCFLGNLSTHPIFYSSISHGNLSRLTRSVQNAYSILFDLSSLVWVI